MKLKRIKELQREATRLTDFCRSTMPDEISVMECENLREFQSAKTTAYTVRDEKREDGYKYDISLDSLNQSVCVSLVKP